MISFPPLGFCDISDVDWRLCGMAFNAKAAAIFERRRPAKPVSRVVVAMIAARNQNDVAALPSWLDALAPAAAL
jgi:hypothetical protein